MKQNSLANSLALLLARKEYEGKDKDGVTPKVKVRTYVAERHSVDAIRDGEGFYNPRI